MGAWGCFKDFEEQLITVYEIAQYYHGSATLIIIMEVLFNDGCTRKS